MITIVFYNLFVKEVRDGKLGNYTLIHWMISMATIKEIKEALAKITDLESPLFKEFEKDYRSGVQKEIEKRKKAIQAEMDENLRLESMLRYEKDLI